MDYKENEMETCQINSGRYKSRTGSTRIVDLNKNSTFSRMRHAAIVVILIQISDRSSSPVQHLYLPSKFRVGRDVKNCFKSSGGGDTVIHNGRRRSG